jgi:hypothetical protein
MAPLPFADNFLAGSLLTLLMPTLLLSAIAVWYVLSVKRVPKDTPESSSVLPPPEILAAAEPEPEPEPEPDSPTEPPVTAS